MSDDEIKASQGEIGKEYVLYMRKDGGTPIKIKLPFKAQKDWLPGIDLTGFDDQQKKHHVQNKHDTYKIIKTGQGIYDTFYIIRFPDKRGLSKL